jgi:transcriptional regulator with XRE-family HTH domain
MYSIRKPWQDWGMGKAGKALKQVLETYGITQGKVSSALEISTSNVYRWCNEVRDPTAERVYELAQALQEIDPAAARDFVRLYLGEFLEER